MVLTELTGENMYHAFLSGALEVIEQKAELNRINVFPVPDGDTGSNLANKQWSLSPMQQSMVQEAIQVLSLHSI